MVYILEQSSVRSIASTRPVGSAGGLRQALVREFRIRNSIVLQEVRNMHHLYRLWRDDEGQDIAEYAVMLAVILVIVVGTIRLIGSNANNVFSNVASSIQ
jgi:Flp pilus assembly pilin Flp